MSLGKLMLFTLKNNEKSQTFKKENFETIFW